MASKCNEVFLGNILALYLLANFHLVFTKLLQHMFWFITKDIVYIIIFSWDMNIYNNNIVLLIDLGEKYSSFPVKLNICCVQFKVTLKELL